MTEANILKLAKQGDVEALTSLMNSQLQLKNVVVQVTIKNGYFQVRLESLQIPEQESLVKYVRQEIIGLKSEYIQKVKVYGFQQGKSFHCWSQDLNLESQPKYTSLTLSQQLPSNILEKAKLPKNNHNINQPIVKIFSNHSQKALNPKIIAILAVIVTMSIYILKESNIFKGQVCIIQNNLQSASINCK
ncbi:hypothetical protein AMR41_11305 [Hapalosiphon sp. MRB220]|nr:hypothetical protein AMR41_11305 [Hapalosiphon sp. MRB220]